MDQCVCTEPNDTSRYAGVRESLKSGEHRGALLDVFFIQQRPSATVREVYEAVPAENPPTRRPAEDSFAFISSFQSKQQIRYQYVVILFV
jgi:hypothetical protein